MQLEPRVLDVETGSEAVSPSMRKKHMGSVQPPDPKMRASEQREYLFDMLAQMASVAASCGELGIEMILTTIVVSRVSGADTAIDRTAGADWTAMRRG